MKTPIKLIKLKEDTILELKRIKLVEGETYDDTIKRLLVNRKFFVVDGHIIEVIVNGANETGDRAYTQFPQN